MSKSALKANVELHTLAKQGLVKYTEEPNDEKGIRKECINITPVCCVGKRKRKRKL